MSIWQVDGGSAPQHLSSHMVGVVSVSCALVMAGLLIPLFNSALVSTGGLTLDGVQTIPLFPLAVLGCTNVVCGISPQAPPLHFF